MTPPLASPPRPLWRTWLLIALPMMMTNALQSLAGTVDGVYLGHLIGTDAIAAVSAFFPVFFFLLAIVIGLSAGATVMIASRKGEDCAKTADELNALDARGHAEGFAGDLSSEAGIAALVAEVGARTDRPDYDFRDGLTLRLFELPDGHRSTVQVPAADGAPGARFEVSRAGGTVSVVAHGATGDWGVEVVGGPAVQVESGTAAVELSL